jgi:hypothetical protein
LGTVLRKGPRSFIEAVAESQVPFRAMAVRAENQSVRTFSQSEKRSTIRVTMPPIVASSITDIEKSHGYCWDSAVIFGSSSLVIFLAGDDECRLERGGSVEV